MWFKLWSAFYLSCASLFLAQPSSGMDGAQGPHRLLCLGGGIRRVLYSLEHFLLDSKSWGRKDTRDKNWVEKASLRGRNFTCKMQEFSALVCGTTWKEGPVLNSPEQSESDLRKYDIRASEAGIRAFHCEWNGLHVNALIGWYKSIIFTQNTNIYY